MRSCPARRAPLWFMCLVAGLLAGCLRLVGPALLSSGGAGAHDDAPQLAFWFWVVALAEALWKGAEVVGRVALAILQYSVHILWRAVTLLGRGAMELAGYAWKGLRQVWGLFKATYTHVLKPAWKFFWKWVDKTERWLQRTFGPLVKWLRRLQKWVLDFYKDYVAPILQLMDITRRALSVLARLGVGWAKTLDAKLAALEDLIQRRYLQGLGYINQVINAVDRIMTADGLFQRLAYIRSLERDYKEAWNVLKGVGDKPLTDDEKKALADKNKPREITAIRQELFEYLQSGTGPKAARLDELIGTIVRTASAR